MPRLTAVRARELLHYDPENGRLTWLQTRGRMAKAGDEAGHQRSDGYRRVMVDGWAYMAHRLAWLWMTDEWPKNEIDHKNADRADNKWDNLRLATSSQNNANERLRARNTSGFRGVSFYKPTRKWRAQISKDRRKYPLGYFATPQEAHAAYAVKARELFGEFARL